MNLKLVRTSRDVDGVFSVLQDDVGNEMAITLEHAYDSGHGDGSYDAKLQPGKYKCVRGFHRLASGPLETFEVLGVKGHSGILFHIGNYNHDSDGCILLGRRIAPNPTKPSENMITSSRNTFNKFMDLQKDASEFQLEVV